MSHFKSSRKNFFSSEDAEQAFSNNLVYKILAFTIVKKDRASLLKLVSQYQRQIIAEKAQMHEARELPEYSSETVI